MDKEDFNFMKVVSIMVSGWMIRCTDMENCTTKMENWLMKETGKIINFQALGEFTMKLHRKCKDPSISEISLILAINGCFMREILKMTVSMVKAKLDFRMVKFLKETLLRTLFKARATFIQQKEKLFMGSGKIIFLKIDFLSIYYCNIKKFNAWKIFCLLKLVLNQSFQ